MPSRPRLLLRSSSTILGKGANPGGISNGFGGAIHHLDPAVSTELQIFATGLLIEFDIKCQQLVQELNCDDDDDQSQKKACSWG